jgi:hypothetical protein
MGNVSSLSCRNIRWDKTPNEQCSGMIYMKYCSFDVIFHRMFRHDIDETLLIRMFRHDIDEVLLIWRYISSNVPAWYRWNIAHLALYLIECSGMIKMKHCSYGVISHRQMSNVSSISCRNIRWDITPNEQCFIYIMPEHPMRYNAKWAMFHLYNAGTFDEI